MDLFTKTELLIMTSIIGFLLFILFVLIISEIISKKREKKAFLKVEENFEETVDSKNSNLQEKEEVLKVEEKKEDLTSNIHLEETLNDEKIIEDIKGPEEIETLVLEIEPTVNVVKIENDDVKNLDLREKAQIELLKVEEELEHVPSLEDTITNLEAIEEENAIISYQELVNNAKESNVVMADDGDEPITIDEVFKMFTDKTEEGLKITESLETVPLTEAYQGDFTSTPYVSPINGLETENLSEIQLENTANLEKLEKEIRKTNEFLNILNELKKNLE